MALSHQWRLQPPYSAAALSTSGLGLGCLGVFNGASETLVGRRRLSPPSVRAAGRVTYSKGIATLYDNSLYTQFPPGAIRSINGEFTIGAWIHPTAFQLYSSIFDNSDSSTVNGLELRLGAGASGPTGAVPSLFKKNSGGYDEWAAGISPSVNADNCIIYSSNGLLEDSGSFVINNVETTSTTQGHTSTGMIAPSSNNFYVGTRADVYTKFTGGIYLVAVWSRILSAKEKADFYWNPWQLFAPIRKQIYFGVTAGGTNTTITPTTGSIIIAGSAPTVAQTAHVSIAPTQGALVIAGAAPTVAVTGNYALTPDQGTLVISGQAPTVTQTTNAAMTPTQGQVVISGYAPTVNTGFSIAPAVGGIVISGAAPTVTQTTNATPTPTQGSLTLTGYAPTVEATGTSIWTNVSAASTIWTNATAATTSWTNQ